MMMMMMAKASPSVVTREGRKNTRRTRQDANKFIYTRPPPQSTPSPTAPPLTVLLGLLGARL